MVRLSLLSGLLLAACAHAGQASKTQDTLVRLSAIHPKALALAVEDMAATFPRRYDAGKYRTLVQEAAARKTRALAALEAGSSAEADALIHDVRAALLANPLLDEARVLAVRRHYGKKARDFNAHRVCTPKLAAYSLESVNVRQHESDVVVLTNLRATPKVQKLFTPAEGGAVAEVDLHFDADRFLYSGVGSGGRWHLHEVKADGAGARRLTPTDAEYDSFDACYLPGGRIVFNSTAPIQGLPCEHGRVPMCNLYLLDPTSGDIRRLTFDQDSNYSPTVMDDGRVMYVRWEYCDLPHFFSRVVMTMMPDGTRQLGYSHSNSFWPNTFVNPKPVPGAPGSFVSVLTGHHAPRPGALGLFDISLGRHEGDGAVQLIPGHNKPVAATIQDGLYVRTWPKYMSPHPLGASPKDGAGRYFLVSAQPTSKSLWGVYLVDVFDNITLLYEEEGCAVNEPIPFAPRPTPPVIPDQVDLKAKDAVVFLADVYQGPGLAGVPRGTVKSLRLFTYHYAYLKSGGHEALGVESSWDVKRILGTAPVAADGSAVFRVPANTPISIQPLDAAGAALQLMRSWFTAMPGEVVSCMGCHENLNAIQPAPALNRPPSDVEPRQGKPRNFSFLREVQPILTRRCAGCHDEKSSLDLASIEPTLAPYDGRFKLSNGGPFSKSYVVLNPYVRRPGPESDIRMFNPMEYHASTSPLIQLLRKGHHGVTLDAAEWERLFTWIDLNAPFWGTWTDAARDWGNEFHRKWLRIPTKAEHVQLIDQSRQLRNRYLAAYGRSHGGADLETDTYSFEQAARDLAGIKPIVPPKRKRTPAPTVAGWPCNGAAKQTALGETRIELALPGGTLAFRHIPAGTFVMGDADGFGDETPRAATVEKTYWMAELEVTNAQYKAFRPHHYSGYIDTLDKDHGNPGLDAGRKDQPVIRVSCDEAAAYCVWLSEKLGRTFRLPTEAEWEWAARAGTGSPVYWGEAPFGAFANLADKTLDKFPQQRQAHNYLLRVKDVDDKAMIADRGGRYRANAFGLHDMIGNVAEWTQGAVARGGSWRDVPQWARAAVRTPYERYQRVYNVGIRLVVEE
ncbi:SUMF1/EgtB/PvdO family nonheme iron enzyme [bacterium]|nr:SUMF1/EgtB/PvdO family nonheme iron enzyme [bacterium]